MARTRRGALLGAGALLAGLSGCSAVEDATETATATAGQREYEGTVDDPASRTVRNPTGEPAVQSTAVEPTTGWADADWLVRSADDREALYFGDAADGVEDARSFVADTDFSTRMVLVHQHPVGPCLAWSLERLRWGDAGGDAPPTSGEVALRYQWVERDGDCPEEGADHVAATFVRIPARFERLLGFSVFVS